MTGSDCADRGEREGLQGRLERIMFDIDVEEIEMPHIVVCRNLLSGDASYSGPYATALAALVSAEHEQQIEMESGGEGDLTFHVAALYPAFNPPSVLRGSTRARE